MPISENSKPAKQLKPFEYVYDAVDFDLVFHSERIPFVRQGIPLSLMVRADTKKKYVSRSQNEKKKCF